MTIAPRPLRLTAMLLVLVCALAPPVMAAPALRDLAGQPRTISDYTGHGKWLVVMIWASDCSVCNADAHNYVDFYNAHHDKDITLLGISMDGWAQRAAAQAFIRRHRVSFPNLIGEPQAVADLYSELTDRPWFGTPTFLIFDPGGALRAQQVGAVPVRIIEQFIASHGARAAGGQSVRADVGGDLAWVR